jgi:glycerol-3-phosphate dehydrogenase
VIRRDLAAAARREFDLLVVGGGIHGVALLQAAARRGLSACLCEARDFGGGTSWNSLRIVHGGLRYLQSADWPRFLQSVAARRRFARVFPRLVQPLQCIMPLYGRGLQRASVLRLALAANDLLSTGRNAGVAGPLRLPAGRVLDRDATRRAFSGVRAEGLEGAACWSDYRMVSSERMLMELLLDACRSGAVACNQAPVVDLIRDGGVVRGATVRDSRSGESHAIAARIVVDCTGPDLNRLSRQASGTGPGAVFRPSLAFNVLLDRELPVASALAVSAPAPGSQVLFVVPQAGSLLAGTMHVARPAGVTEGVPTGEEIDRFLQTLNAALPGLDVGPRDVQRVFAGLLPVTEAGGTTLTPREEIIDHGRRGGLRNFYSVSGVKWTTACDVADRTLRLVGAPRGRYDDRALTLSPATDLLTDARQLWTLDPAESSRLLRSVIDGESVHELDDLVFRRSNWAASTGDLLPIRERAAQLLAT